MLMVLCILGFIVGKGTVKVQFKNKKMHNKCTQKKSCTFNGSLGMQAVQMTTERKPF